MSRNIKKQVIFSQYVAKTDHFLNKPGTAHHLSQIKPR